MSGHRCPPIAIEIAIEIGIQSVPLIGVVDLTLPVAIPSPIPISISISCRGGVSGDHVSVPSSQRVWGSAVEAIQAIR
jgi:hypothetical protein